MQIFKNYLKIISTKKSEFEKAECIFGDFTINIHEKDSNQRALIGWLVCSTRSQVALGHLEAMVKNHSKFFYSFTIKYEETNS